MTILYLVEKLPRDPMAGWRASSPSVCRFGAVSSSRWYCSLKSIKVGPRVRGEEMITDAYLASSERVVPLGRAPHFMSIICP